ncbi:transposase IS4 family protein [Thiorhodococcus drewsii AZ1]|uniref:Transposase IS4 family protein n=1 Tax=Thiorhodococcus drewsii AZ1 TaxID=765913 RepID=G2E8T4_9GAMM|nr:IS5 family transposase [Thiorhodococcus drewsii]EGV27488.1 transposase IS4 family protein [Thiorhodococcus drewsii AZ1]
MQELTKKGEQAIGRSKGGLSTKIHARTDALGNPTGFYLTGGQASDLVGADHLPVDLEVEALLADKAYDADERVLDVLEACGAIAVIPPKRNRLVQRAYDKELYKARHLIENFFSKIKHFRAIATPQCQDKLSRNFLAGVHLASACVLLN